MFLGKMYNVCLNAVCVKKSCTICDVPNVFIDIIKVFLLSNYFIGFEKEVIIH